MICETCDGEGWVMRDSLPTAAPGDPLVNPYWEPCPDCDGCGLAYCCEGAPDE